MVLAPHKSCSFSPKRLESHSLVFLVGLFRDVTMGSNSCDFAAIVYFLMMHYCPSQWDMKLN